VEKVKNVSCVSESLELQKALQVKCLPLTGHILNIVWMCVVPLMLLILRSTCDIQNLKMYRYLQYTLWLNIYKCLFHCHLRPDTPISTNTPRWTSSLITHPPTSYTDLSSPLACHMELKSVLHIYVVLDNVHYTDTSTGVSRKAKR
jgi:hypothetical protein